TTLTQLKIWSATLKFDRLLKYRKTTEQWFFVTSRMTASWIFSRITRSKRMLCSEIKAPRHSWITSGRNETPVQLKSGAFLSSESHRILGLAAAEQLTLASVLNSR